MAELPPVRVELLADVREFIAKMGEAEHAVTKLGKAGDTASARLGAVGQKLATGVLATLSLIHI